MKNCAETDGGGGGDCLANVESTKDLNRLDSTSTQLRRSQQRQPRKGAQPQGDKELEAAATELQSEQRLKSTANGARLQSQQHVTRTEERGSFVQPSGRNDELDDISFAANDNYEAFDSDHCRNLDSGYAWIILLVMFLLGASVGGASRVYGLVYAKQVAIGYYDHEQASWPIATASTIENLAGILTPALARFLSWRKIQLLSSSLFILANLGAHFSGSLLIDILCLGLIQGLGLSINTVLALAINNDYFERYRTTAYGIIMSGSTCGTFVMGPVISWVLEEFENFRFAYLAIAAFFGLNIVLALFIVPRQSAPNWTLCSSQRQIGAAAAMATSGQTGPNKKTPADDIRSQKSAAGVSARLQHWPNRKVSQFASHFERKNSIASISVQCGISRQSSLSRGSSDWLGPSGAAGGLGGLVRPNYKGSVRGVSRDTSPNAKEPNFVARSISNQVETSTSGPSGGGVGCPRRVGGHKISAHSLHTGYNSASKNSPTTPTATVGAAEPEQACERAHRRKISQIAKQPATGPSSGGALDANVSKGEPEGGGEPGSEEPTAAREHKKSVISFRAPAIAYELELSSCWQQQSDCESLASHEQGRPVPCKTGQSDVTSSAGPTAVATEKDWCHQHRRATTTPSCRGACELDSSAANNAHSLEMDNVLDNMDACLANEPERFNLASAFKLLKLPYLHCVWIMLSLYYLIARIFIIILTDFADDHGLEMEQSRQLLNYWSLGEIFGRIFLSSFIDLQWLSVKSCVVLTCSALSASISLMVAVEGHYYFYALCSTLVAAFVSLEYMLINVLMVEYLGKSRVIGCYSLGSLLSSLLLFGRPALIGFFRDQLGSYDGLLVLLAALTLSYALLFGLLEPLLVRKWPKAAQTAQQ